MNIYFALTAVIGVLAGMTLVVFILRGTGLIRGMQQFKKDYVWTFKNRICPLDCPCRQIHPEGYWKV